MVPGVQPLVGILVVVVLVLFIAAAAGLVVSAAGPLSARGAGLAVAIGPRGRRGGRWRRRLLQSHGVGSPQGCHVLAADSGHRAQIRNGPSRHVYQVRGPVSRVCRQIARKRILVIETELYTSRFEIGRVFGRIYPSIVVNLNHRFLNFR